jgi:hypothetical protein
MHRKLRRQSLNSKQNFEKVTVEDLCCLIGKGFVVMVRVRAEVREYSREDDGKTKKAVPSIPFLSWKLGNKALKIKEKYLN